MTPNPKSTDTDHLDELYETAVEALLSPIHQATTREEIAQSAARRTRTVQDMRWYWNRLVAHHHQNKNSAASPALPRMIHITGTKGKGSTACFCESVLRSHGYRTGLLTSPHLLDIRERIRWNGRPIHRHIFGRVYWTVRRALEEDTTETEEDSAPPRLPGYFRMLTLMGFYTFLHFLPDSNNAGESRHCGIHVLIVEVGMGGRYDATNFMDPSSNDDNDDMQRPITCCGVTLLDLDHVRILGDTLEKIAWEKGGIFANDKLETEHISLRPGTEERTEPKHPSKKRKTEDASAAARKFFILDSNTNGVMAVMKSCATIEGHGGELVPVDASGKALREALQNQQLGLAGDHQYGNATLAVELCRHVMNDAHIKISHNSVTLKGLQKASWPGRCQIYHNRSKFVYYLDGAHTPQSVEATAKWFQDCIHRSHAAAGTPIVLVFNTSHERDPYELLSILTSMRDSDDAQKVLSFARVYFPKSDSSRPSPVAKMTLQEVLQKHGKDLHEQQDDVTKDDKSGAMTWQDTLAGVYRYLSTKDETAANSDKMVIHTNLSATEVVEDLHGHFQTTDGRLVPVFVTGSLYLVGSFLKALNWKEESSQSI
jgi:folylpolyglutamate synthase